MGALALQYRKDVEAIDPEVKCGVVKYVTMGSATRSAALANAIANDVSICANPQELLKTIADYKADQHREGAPVGFIRRSPESKQLYQDSCPIDAINLKKAERSGTCVLSNTVPANASIYRIEYACNDPRCGYSYHRDDSKGYAMDAQLVPPATLAAPVRSIVWHRRWDGDPHLERYIMYYEVPYAERPEVRPATGN